MRRALLLMLSAGLLAACNSAPPPQTAANTVGGPSVRSVVQASRASLMMRFDMGWGSQGHPNQFVIADVLTYSGGGPKITAPDGWHLLRDDHSPTTRQSLYWHLIANDESTAAWTFSEPLDAQGVILLLDNVATGSPVDITSGNVGTGGTLIAKSVETEDDGDLILSFFACDFSHSPLHVMAPPRMRPVVVRDDVPQEYWIFSTYQATSGDTQDVTFSAPQLFNWVGAQVAIRRGGPASASGAVYVPPSPPRYITTIKTSTILGFCAALGALVFVVGLWRVSGATQALAAGLRRVSATSDARRPSIADRSVASDRTRPTLATTRKLLAAGAICAIAGCLVIRWLDEDQTRIALISLIVALGALAASFTLSDPEPMTEAALKRDELLSQAAVFILFLAFYAATAGTATSPYDAHVRQAFALVHGHLWIDAPNYIEHAHFEGRDYQLHPLLPAFLLVPAVALWGMDTSQTIFSIIMGAIDAALAWRLVGEVRLSVNARLWLTFFFGAGTIVWSETVNGSSWAVSMVVAVALTLLALSELFDRARPGVIGAAAGLAALARYDLAFVWPVWILLTYYKRRNLRELLWMAPGFALTTILYATLNEARFGSPFDRGVFIFAPEGTHLFSSQYLPGNIFTLFFMSPSVNGTFPYIHPQFGGQALVLTSPAFILALRPSFRRLVPAALLVAALIAITPGLFYFTNGFSQFGTRHYIHAFPFLFALMALGLPTENVDQLTRILIAISVFLIAYGVWHVRIYGLGG